METNKQEWYLKLLAKLKRIESGELLLADYISQVEEKSLKPIVEIEQDYSKAKNLLGRFAQCYGPHCWNNGKDGVRSLPSGEEFIDIFAKEIVDKFSANTLLSEEDCEVDCQFHHFIENDGRVPCCKTWRETPKK